MNERTRNVVALVVMAVLIGVSLWLFIPPQKTITEGLDIQGGLSVILTAEESTSTGAAVTSADMSRAELIVQNRVNALGASETTVQKQGNNSILVQIPGIKNADEALKVLGSTGQLEFVEVASINDTETVTAIATGQKDVPLKKGTYTPFMTGSSVKKATASNRDGKFEVDVELDEKGTQQFATETTKLAPTKGQIAIVLDGVVQSAPAVQDAITSGKVAISGSFTATEAKNLQTVLETGALPVSLKFSESRVVGPTLGRESLNKGLFAAALGLGIIVVYLLIFYRGLGILTVFAMTVFAILYLGVLALLSRFGAFALSLPGIAGIVLTIGIAADSSILILERFKEEIAMGRSLRAAAKTGVSHAIKTSVDADLVTMVSALALFFIAVGPVKGFGLTLAIGIVCDIVVMLLFKAPLIRLMAPGVFSKGRAFWGIPKDQTPKKASSLKGGVAHD